MRTKIVADVHTVMAAQEVRVQTVDAVEVGAGAEVEAEVEDVVQDVVVIVIVDDKLAITIRYTTLALKTMWFCTAYIQIQLQS